MNWITLLGEIDLYHVISSIELNPSKGTSDIDICEGVQVGDIIYVVDHDLRDFRHSSIVYRMEVDAVRCMEEKLQRRNKQEIIGVCDAHITHPMMYSHEHLNLSIPLLSNIDKELIDVPQKLTQEAADYLQNIFEHEKEYRNIYSIDTISTLKTLAIISDY